MNTNSRFVKTSRAKHPSVLRENLKNRLQYLAEQSGSVRNFANLCRVNRTQMNRYLNGSSVPRAELLAQIGQVFDIPLDWFFEAGDSERQITELEFGAALRHLVSQRNVEVPEEYLPSGFYLFWKQMFSDKNKVEVLLGKVSVGDGVRRLKFSMVRDAIKHGEIEALWERDRYCESVLCRSGRNLCMLSSDGIDNVVMLGYFVKRTTLVRALSKSYFTGTFHCPMSGNPEREALVKCVLEQVPCSTKDVLTAGRKTGRTDIRNLPSPINKMFEEIKIPSFQLP